MLSEYIDVEVRHGQVGVEKSKCGMGILNESIFISTGPEAEGAWVVGQGMVASFGMPCWTRRMWWQPLLDVCERRVEEWRVV